jgi:hypothetical protein
MKVKIYIGFSTLKMKCNQYGGCEEVTFKNARTTIFLEVGQGGSRKSLLLCGAAAPDRRCLPKRLVRVGYRPLLKTRFMRLLSSTS